MVLVRRSPALTYLVAILGSALVVLSGSALHGSVGSLITSTIFILAIVTVGTLGGWKPSLLAILLSALGAVYFIIEPRYTFRVARPADLLGLGAYLVAGLVISVLCEGLHAFANRILERQRRLEEEIVERRRAELEVHAHADRLREADRLKDEFLATLAHELRNPLAPLSNALQVWPLIENDPAQVKDLRAMMQRQLQLMTRLIEDLFDVSRISRGKIQIRPQPVDISTVVSDAVEAFTPFINECGHELSVSLPADTLCVYGDSARLSQIIGNVLHNAAKYTPAGGRICVIAEAQADRAVVRVRDNGCGIAKPMLTRIFDMYHQIDQTLDRSRGGLGIGLTLVKRLVELHGGTIEARSDGPGKGSEFVISLPLEPPEECTADESQSPAQLART